MQNLIQPKILKGFRDFLPRQEIQRNTLIEKITQVYRSFGFVPIDTPVLEYTDILLRKSNGETEKQVFRFTDNGGRDVAMRFDLTVPFARFTAEHFSEIYMPFKRYHIAKVWRGEKPQAGRYREFIQCDVDTVGSDSSTSDFEILHSMKTALNAIGVKNIRILVNHRAIFNCFLEKMQLKDKSDDIMRVVDKKEKISNEEFEQELLSALTDAHKDALPSIINFISKKGSFEETLFNMANLAGDGAKEHVARLNDVYQMMCAAGIEKTFELDPVITRGLDYYTGIVFETFLFKDENCTEKVPIGSICSGGRYDNLAGLYMKERVPGVGGSIGLDRLIAGLELLGLTEQKGSYIDVEIFCSDASLAVEYQKIASKLRDANFNVEVFPDAKKMNQQYAVAEAKNVPFGILMNKEQAQKDCLTLKNLLTREQFVDISVDDAIKILQNVLC